ncbi:MAG: histone H1 [Bacteroidota bacterium]|jgi:hypothetical protein
MNQFQDLLVLVQSFEKDFEKFFESQNKEAGIRVRKHMQMLKQKAKSIRDGVQTEKKEFPTKRQDVSLKNKQNNPSTKLT